MSDRLMTPLFGALCGAFLLAAPPPASAAPSSVADRYAVGASRQVATSVHYTGYPHRHSDDGDHDDHDDRDGR
jgi:hypothetical protein